VDGADHRPFGPHLLDSPQEELAGGLVVPKWLRKADYLGAAVAKQWAHAAQAKQMIVEGMERAKEK
jgi:hypothetical protein